MLAILLLSSCTTSLFRETAARSSGALQGYRVYASEVNLLARTPTCVEYGLMRTTPCV